MPREIITGEAHDASIMVGWSRDLDVQVGIQVANVGYSDRPLPDVETPLTIARTLWGSDDALMSIGGYLAGHDRAVELGAAIISLRNGEIEDEEDVWAANRFVGSLVVEALDNHRAGTDGIRSLWWNPNRWQINRLIALLRRARDAAYGKDQ